MDKVSATYYVIEKPEAVVNFFGFLFTALTFWFTTKREREQREDSAEKDRALQHRRNYLSLELEASRIFQVCVQNPDIPLYLRGDLPESADNKYVAERSYWFVCQCLNAFEIIISFRKEGMVANDLFATWISWFHELATSDRFADYWIGQALWCHYKPELQDIINVAVALRAARAPDFAEDVPAQLAELEAFHRDAARVLNDTSIETHFRESRARNIARPAVLAPAPQPAVA